MKKENTPQIDPKQEEIIEEIAEIKEVAAALEEEQEKEDAFAVEDTSPETEEAPAEGKDNEAKEAKDPAEETDGPLSSFLNREEETEKKNDKDSDSPKKKKIPWWIIVCGAVVIALVVILLVLLLQPIKPSDDQNQYQEAQFEISVDENGEHQAQVPTNEAGEIEQNGVGTLLAYDVFSVSQIDVQNQSGSFSVTSYTPTTTDEDGNEVTDTTVYSQARYSFQFSIEH